MNQEENKIQDLSQDEQVVQKNDVILETPKTKQPIYVRTLNVFVNPWRQRYDKHYRQSKKHLIMDLILVFLIVVLIIVNIVLASLRFPVENVEIKINRGQVSGETDKLPEVIADTKLFLDAQAVYYNADGEQLGVGPWPPEVGATTNINVAIKIATGSHNLKEARVKVKLGEQVAWTNKTAVNAGAALAYDKKENTVSWNLDSLTVGERAQANFELSFSPVQNDENKKIKLVEQIEISGIDIVTGNTVALTGGQIYTALVLKAE
jgi:hypothetical protein